MRINVMALAASQRLAGRKRDSKPLSARELVRDAHKYADMVSERGFIGPTDMATISDIRYGAVSFESAVRRRFGKDEEGNDT